MKTVAVTVNGDTDPEPDETFKVKLSNAVNATITDSIGKGTIKNDETYRQVDPASLIDSTDLID